VFKQVGSFQPVKATEFQKLFEAKKKIDVALSDVLLQGENAANERIAKNQNLKDVEEWYNSPTATWNLVNTADHKVCHYNCEVDPTNINQEKEHLFSQCRCFTQKVAKHVRLTTDAERNDLLAKLSERTSKRVAHETYKETGSGTIVQAESNFVIAGTEVRGAPGSDFIPSQFGKEAHAWTTKSEIASGSLPKTLTLFDWSNMEQGKNMKCSNCQKSLMCHTLDQSEPKMRITNPSRELEFQNKKIEAEARLKEAVNEFKRIAPANSFGRIVNQSMAYLQAVRDEHVKEGKNEKAKQVETAIEKFKILQKAE